MAEREGDEAMEEAGVEGAEDAEPGDDDSDEEDQGSGRLEVDANRQAGEVEKETPLS